jgi:hypothetical protein
MRSPDDAGVKGRIIVYRKHFLKLLAYPKPLRDQLLFELPILEGFRTGEVVTLRVEDVDFENGDIYPLDSKKHKHFPVPLDPIVAEHLAEYIKRKRLASGYIIRRGSGQGRWSIRHQETSILPETVFKAWQKYCKSLDITEMSPRMGRAYFACKWVHVDHKSVFSLMAIMRHEEFNTTVHYLSKIWDYEMLRSDFYQGMESPFASDCARGRSCPLSAPGCKCHAFTPRVEELPVIGECASFGSCHFATAGCRCKTYVPKVEAKPITAR